MRAFVYTRHSEEQLVERQLDRAWVERTVEEPEIRQPDPRDPTVERLFKAIPELGGRFLRVVVCFESDARCRIVTVHLDRGMRKSRR